MSCPSFVNTNKKKITKTHFAPSTLVLIPYYHAIYPITLVKDNNFDSMAPLLI